MATIVKNRGSDTEISYASPRIAFLTGEPVLPGPPPGQDGRKRRTRGSSEDEDDEPMDGFISEDLRAGGPYLCSIPIISLVVPDNHPLARYVSHNFSKFRETVATILRTHNVDYYSFDICGRRSRYHPEPLPIPTVLVHANMQDPLNKSWINASRAISSYITKEGLTGISVEITDRRAYEPLQYSSVFPTDAIVPVWEDVLKEIFTGVDLTDIKAVGCYRIGKSESSNNRPPTVQITVSRTSSRNWKPVRERIVAILNGFGLMMVAITVLKGEILRGLDGIFESRLPPTACKESAQVGMSLGIHGSRKSSSTFGGIIELRHPGTGQWKKLGLTCFHCVDPSGKDDIKPSPHFDTWCKKGVKAGDINARQLLQVDVPSLGDLETEIKRLDGDINAVKTAADFTKVDAALRAGEFVIPGDLKMYERMKKLIDDYTQEKSALEKMQSSGGLFLGRVFAGSGYQERLEKTVGGGAGSIRDWALIEVKDSRMGDNTIDTYGSFPRGFPLDPCSQLRSPSGAIPTSQQPLFKLGRSTNYTTGEYSEIRTAIIATTQDEKGNTVSKPTLEHAVLGNKGNHFADLGDSGCLVFDVNTRFVGMVFGGSREHPISYMTLAQDLFEDIKLVTGATEVRLPE